MKGLDIGTGNFVLADDSGIYLQRNAFLTLKKGTASFRQLKILDVPYVEIEGRVHIVGQKAYEYAQVFNTTDLRRPMAGGLLNPSEQDALPVLKVIIEELIKQAKAAEPGERITYSIPGHPLDQDREVDYHEDVLGQIITSLGFKTKSLNEGVALGTAGLINNKLTGISISMGAGMCLKGDTKIPLLDGTIKTIKELSDLGKQHIFWVYSCKEDGQIVPGKASNAHKVKTSKELLRITFDNNKFLECTPDHKIMLRNGSYEEAQNLKNGMSIMPLYTKKYNGKYRRIWNNKYNRWNNEHRLVWKQHNNADITKVDLVHHLDYNPANNIPENLKVMTKKAHLQLHRTLAKYNTAKAKGKTYDEIYGKNKAYKIKSKQRTSHKNWWSGLSTEEQNQYKLKWPVIKKVGQTLEETFGKKIADKIKKNSSETMKKTFLAGKLGTRPPTKETLKKCQENGFGTYKRTPEHLNKISNTLFKKEQIPWNKGLKGDLYKTHFKQGFSNQTGINYNHKIIKIEKIETNEDVYDISVEKYHNFAIDAGIFVHNCNIAILYAGMSALQFSVSKGGDWIDTQVSTETNISKAQAQFIKESGDYTIDPASKDTRSRAQQAIKTYYESLIRYLLANIEKQFTSNNMPAFPQAVPIVVGGGTAMVKGFLEVFKDQFTQKEFPLNISDIVLVDEPLTAVARGCYLDAQLGD